ncbi:MAG: formylglycine-generating enzyme family protein [Magnetovibrio sp.]|nr:formylglycine-generating enzyme family protein [Magnetovibrio sp.]
MRLIFHILILLICLTLRGQTAVAQSAVKPFKDCDTCPELTIIPPGSFTMGTESRHKTERPAHKVTIDYPFAMGIYEVSFDEWQVCFDAGFCGDKMPDDHKWGTGKRPIINITWWEAQKYLAWLSDITGKTYRLPTESEWEYAARAGSPTEYWWGDKIGKETANCRDCGPKISHKSQPVDSFEPNPWGLYNVHGNVWEWTQDCWNKTYDGAPTDGSAWEDGDCRQRVMRSGSWYYFSKNLRSAWRAKNHSKVKSYGIGFRVVRELP